MFKRLLTGFILFFVFMSTSVLARPPGASVLMLTTRIDVEENKTDLMVVLVYDENKKVWRLPGGSMKAEDGGYHFNTAIRKVREELKLDFSFNDITNLNRSYTDGTHTVYAVGDETCRGLFFLDGKKVPIQGYVYPATFISEKIEESIQTVQALESPASPELHAVKQVVLVEIGRILTWLKTNDIASSGEFPIGNPIDFPTEYDPTATHKIDYYALYDLIHSTMLESSGCSAQCMLELITPSEQRAYLDSVLAGYFSTTYEEISKAPKVEYEDDDEDEDDD
ncbi:NUDIX hydrolase [Spongorhabdus nitratireducens]